MVRTNQLYEKPGKYYRQMRSSECKGPVLEAADPGDYSGASEGRECHEAKERRRNQIARSARLF